MNDSNSVPILYFPVKSSPLQMEAGFHPLGKDLGAGRLDHKCFLQDEQFKQYIDNKIKAEPFGHWVTWQSENRDDCKSHAQLHKLAIKRLVDLQEQDLSLPSPPSFNQWEVLAKQDEIAQDKIRLRALTNQLYRELSGRVQEDICVLMQHPHSSLIMGHICTPSFWNPSQVKNASFWSIHKPVPGFPRDERVASRLAEHITQKGPLVRFVWTLTADAKLDQHPRHPRTSWLDHQELCYRVERQITIPLQGIGALFLIRTYVHPLHSLSTDHRLILRQAIEAMPNEIAKYKGLNMLKSSPHLLNLIEGQEV